jgi:hypothetical protein
MGMGEPLLNLPAVIPAVRYLQDTLGISGRNITISTVGVPNALRKLAAAQLTATLAVSIHAPNQVGRHPSTICVPWVGWASCGLRWRCGDLWCCPHWDWCGCGHAFTLPAPRGVVVVYIVIHRPT